MPIGIKLDGSNKFPYAVVSLYADLPASTGSGLFYFVEEPKNSFWVKYPRGFYEDSPSGWIDATLKVQASMDSGTVINWTDWSAYIAASNGIGIGDRVIFKSVSYENLTGVESSTAPDIDITNWSSQIAFNPQLPPTHKEGLVFYDSNKKALSYYNENSNVTVNMGQELLFRVENQTGQTIPNGTVIYPDGTTIIGLADAHVKNKSRLIAVTTHEILDGETGYATRLGQVGGVDTSSYSAGQIIYLGTNGQFTDVIPNDGGYAIIVGVVDVVDALEGIITVDPQLSELTVEVTDTNGFPPDQRANTTLLAQDGTRLFIIIADTGDFHYYELGNKFESTGDAITWSDAEGEHWFFFEEGVLIVEHEPSDARKNHIILNHAFIATIYWNATDKKVEIGILDERHGISMSPTTHLYLHLTRGAQYLNGLGLGNFNIGNGNLNIDAQFSVASGMFFDEDLPHTINSLAVGDTIPVVYNLGTTPNIRTGTQTGFSVLNAPAGRLYYNQNVGGNWQLTEVADRDYVLYHIFAINGQDQGLISIMGQNEYATAGDARTGANTEISNIVSNLPFAEFVPIGTIIYQTRSSYSNTVKAKIVLTDEGENYVPWTTTELSQGASPSSHANLTNLELANTGVTWGHVSNTQPLTVASLTTIERDAITPVNGMILYNTTTNQFNFYENGAWVTK